MRHRKIKSRIKHCRFPIANQNCLPSMFPQSHSSLRCLFTPMPSSSHPVMFLPCSGVLMARHEMNGVSSLLENFPKVSKIIATKLKSSVSREVHALGQGLLFVSPSSPFLQGCFCCIQCSKWDGSIPRCFVGRRWQFQSVVGSEVCVPTYWEGRWKTLGVTSLHVCFWQRRHSC